MYPLLVLIMWCITKSKKGSVCRENIRYCYFFYFSFVDIVLSLCGSAFGMGLIVFWS